MSSNPVTAVILSRGSRLSPLTNRCPKPMVPVANRPLLHHIIEAVTDAGIGQIVLVVGYQQERIRNYLRDGDEWGVSIEYIVQSAQLGTGHAVLQAEPVVERPFMLLNRDRIVGYEILSTVSDRVRHGSLPMMAITTTD